MKFVNDKGLSTPERLYAIGNMLQANFRWYAKQSTVPQTNFLYGIESLYANGEQAEYTQVEVGQLVYWIMMPNADNAYLCMIGAVTDSHYSFSSIVDVKGEAGDNGKDALATSERIADSNEPNVATSYSFAVNKFNRTPEVNDIFNFVFYQTPPVSKTFLCSAKISSVSGNTALANIITYTDTTGEQGAQGPAGTIDQAQINSIKNDILQTIYPVGAYYITDKNENPAITFGFGTWTAVLGKFLLGATSDYPVGSIGGEKEHTLSLNEIPAHGHKLNAYTLIISCGANTGKYKLIAADNAFVNIFYEDSDQNRYSDNAGGGQPHNNMPPYRAAFIWRRTA